MGDKLRLCLLFSRFRINTGRLINRLPHRLRVFGAPLLGGLIGLIGGIPGLLIGLLLGYLLGQLFVQSGRNRRILAYFENPGSQQFYEGEPGLAAWCALAVLVASENSGDNSGAPAPAEKILKEAALEASCVFTSPLADPFLVEHFSRMALSSRNNLNPDLLAESLIARRIPLGAQGNMATLGRGLSSLAGGEKAKALARQIRRILGISPEDEDSEISASENHGMSGDPWKILGLPPGTSLREVKAHYRRLAKQFHPDNFVLLDEKHRETAARAFIAIQEAYKKISDYRILK